LSYQGYPELRAITLQPTSNQNKWRPDGGMIVVAIANQFHLRSSEGFGFSNVGMAKLLIKLGN
jgi:hypothetical protein